MEKQLFELMTKLYNKVEDIESEMQKGFNQLKSRIGSVEKEVREIKSTQLRMENTLGTKIDALFDAREVQIDIDEKVAHNLQRVETKVDKLEWRVLRNNLDIPKSKEH